MLCRLPKPSRCHALHNNSGGQGCDRPAQASSVKGRDAGRFHLQEESPVGRALLPIAGCMEPFRGIVWVCLVRFVIPCVRHSHAPLAALSSFRHMLDTCLYICLRVLLDVIVLRRSCLVVLLFVWRAALGSQVVWYGDSCMCSGWCSIR